MGNPIILASWVTAAAVSERSPFLLWMLEQCNIDCLFTFSTQMGSEKVYRGWSTVWWM